MVGNNNLLACEDIFLGVLLVEHRRLAFVCCCTYTLTEADST
jgi:hypothetical protein